MQWRCRGAYAYAIQISAGTSAILRDFTVIMPLFFHAKFFLIYDSSHKYHSTLNSFK